MNPKVDSNAPDPQLETLPMLVSGGQTGADRAGLDWAIAHDVPHGGWCPKGRLAEDGPIPARYDLKETASARYPQRTKANVHDSDSTVIFTLAPAPLMGGSALTARCAGRRAKPCLHLWPDKDGMDDTALGAALAGFLTRHHVRILNVAGSRASGEPEVGAFVGRVLDAFQRHLMLP